MKISLLEKRENFKLVLKLSLEKFVPLNKLCVVLKLVPSICNLKKELAPLELVNKLVYLNEIHLYFVSEETVV